MFIESDDLSEIDDGRIIQFALFPTGDEFNVIDFQFVLFEIVVVVLVVAFESDVLELELLHPQLQLLELSIAGLR